MKKTDQEIKILKCKKCGCDRQIVSKSENMKIVITCGDCGELLFQLLNQ